MPTSIMSTIDEQERLLQESVSIVKTQAFHMKRALDRVKLMDALKNGSIMLGELRTSLLSPKSYYELYMAVTDELRHLELYLLDEFQKGRNIADLYELVQYAGNIVPRIYLLITVGIVYIKTNTTLRRNLLKDMVEMCRGVQHPLRGLFLRNYLLQCTRNILPDVPDTNNTTDESLEGTVSDSIEFVLSNFAEMNKLWVRMQHQGHTRDRQHREKEREELKILVGTNLVRLSQLECVTLEKYQRVVLPSILEQIVSCRDAIAQEYLMECIIQVFPDEFHIQTLNPFLKSCSEFEIGVNVKNIIISLMDRLANFKQKIDTFNNKENMENGVFDNVQLFELFLNQIELVVSNRQDLSPEYILALHVALMNLALKCYPDRIDYVDSVMVLSVETLRGLGTRHLEKSSVVARELQKLLKIPVNHYNDLLTILKLQHYSELMSYLNYYDRKLVGIYLINNTITFETIIPTQGEAEQALVLFNALITKEDDDPSDTNEDISEELFLMARFIQQVYNENLDEHYLTLNAIRKYFEQEGGLERTKYVIPTIVFEAYTLTRKYKQSNDEKWPKKCQKVFQFCHTTLQLLVKSEMYDLALRLFLQGALTVDQITCENHESIAYEFMSQAFTIYEEEISDSKAQFAALTLIIGTMEKITCFTEENAEPLKTQCALAANKLLKKSDQCRAIAICSHLFFKNTNDDGKRIMDCLQKCRKLAGQCMDPQITKQLDVELLNHYIYYLDKKCSFVKYDVVNKIIEYLRETLCTMNSSSEADQIITHFTNTMQHIQMRDEQSDYDDIYYAIETNGNLVDLNYCLE